ncbi:MAG: hypothetical protein LBE16_01750 [Clostridiales Family XIII bacterium]|jgi:hypothetical protein|nr:hypothetical protein [Clostridiales Family XIII bacterium]
MVKKGYKAGPICVLLLAALVIGCTGVAFAAAVPEDENPPAAAETAVSAAADTAFEEELADAPAKSTQTGEAPAKKPRGGRNSKAVRGGGAKADVISVAASVLGVSVDTVKASVKTGKVGDLLLAADKVEAFKAEYLAVTKAALTAAVAESGLTQERADAKYAEAQAKMEAYDGTAHLCGGADHGKMFESAAKPESDLQI